MQGISALWHLCHIFNQSWQVVIIFKFQISSIPVIAKSDLNKASWDGLDRWDAKKYSTTIKEAKHP